MKFSFFTIVFCLILTLGIYTASGLPLKLHSTDFVASIEDVLASFQQFNPDTLFQQISSFFDSLIESAQSFEWPSLFGDSTAIVPRLHSGDLSDTSEDFGFSPPNSLPNSPRRPGLFTSGESTSYSDSGSL